MLCCRAGKKGGREPIEEITAIIQMCHDTVQTNVVAKEKKPSAMGY